VLVVPAPKAWVTESLRQIPGRAAHLCPGLYWGKHITIWLGMDRTLFSVSVKGGVGGCLRKKGTMWRQTDLSVHVWNARDGPWSNFSFAYFIVAVRVPEPL